MAATGEQFDLVLKTPDGEVTATIAELAAGLRGLTVDGAELVSRYPDDRTPPYGSGMILVPWPNRIADAQWILDGEVQKLDITELTTGNASHGLLRNTGYRVTDRTESAVTLAAPIFPQHGYPFLLHTSVRYQLEPDGLRVIHGVVNDSAVPAPVAIGAHPYIRAGAAPVESLTVTVAADSYFEVDEKQIPIASKDVAGSDFDLRTGRVLGEVALDTGFSGLHLEDGAFRHRLESPDGTAVELWADEDFGYVQVFTLPHYAGLDGPEFGVAIEPMTAPANAFNSGEGLRWLQPGEEWIAAWGVRRLR
ncbi:aldose 1-epimerase family protein [Naasia lichenicola]|uniref:Aldose epimerase n=1 Tax=Naasia lichenicola TaxID=2565933 RepID=A0A4S4FHN3_9MICO|nr:aldose 1-epimerase family protein [Naasia lichenicola]THG29799.1 aldose epimerase [Naasia lichenicola]